MKRAWTGAAAAVRRATVSMAAVTLLASASAQAEPLAPRETADVLPRGQWQVGLFNPLRIGMAHGELVVHPLVALAAPHAEWRVAVRPHRAPGDLRLTAVAGLAVPTPAWRMAKPFGLSGDLVPSCKVATHDPALVDHCQRPGWLVVPKLGLQLSQGYGARDGAERGVWTLSAEISKGIAVVGDAARPLDAWAPVAVQFAPHIGLWRAQGRLAWDHALVDALRLRAELAVHWIGRPADDSLSPWYVSGYAGLDFRLSSHLRGTLGAIWWNADKHQRTVTTGADGFAEVRYVRSNEVWPTVDVVWSY
jgi:hypothetical protein